MSRTRLESGEIGSAVYRTMAGGLIQARAYMRDDKGERHRPSGLGKTQEEALAALKAQAEAILYEGDFTQMTASMTVKAACAIWLSERRDEGKDGIAMSSIESYENDVRTVVVPACGEVLLGDLTVMKCDRILRQLMKKRSVSAARKARKVLSQVCTLAMRAGVLTSNPIRDVRSLPTSAKKESFLTPVQIGVVRKLMRGWRLESKMGPRPDVEKLEDGMDIMIGTSCRIGEVLALRRCDVDVTTNPPTVLVNSTLSQTRANGLVRKPTPKHRRQRRRIALPDTTAAAVRRRLSLAEPGPDAYLFSTASGAPYSVSNYERLLRTFVHDNEDAIRKADIIYEEFSPHLFRRTAATLVERGGGITLASRLLGHSSEAITRASYVVTAEMVDPSTADILNRALAD